MKLDYWAGILFPDFPGEVRIEVVKVFAERPKALGVVVNLTMQAFRQL
jgi:hypothetical protein